MTAKLLVVDDDRDLVELLRMNLGAQGYIIHTALSGAEALSSVRTSRPDLILLDISDQAHDPTAALMRFLRDGLDTRIIGVNLRDDCISIYYKDQRVMQGVGDLLRVIQEAENAACSECSAKEVN